MVRRVVIVGGGTAGWMTAAYLSKALTELEVTVVESPQVPIIGVGEASFSTAKLFFDFLGLAEEDWMPRCNATFKLGIKFVNWTAAGGHFYHPFQRYRVVDGYSLGEWWLKLKRGSEPFDYACFSTPTLCDACRAPRRLDGSLFDPCVQSYYSGPSRGRDSLLDQHTVQYPYGYQFDAALLALLARDYAVARGVRHVPDHVTGVAFTESGALSHVVTQEHGPIGGDLFVDCSGFRSLLLRQALDEPFISFSDSLLCDRAVAMRVPAAEELPDIEPFTTATALTCGWVWNIPLYDRVGTGYVYSSQFTTPEAAEEELRRHLGPRSDSHPANHIRMRIGRSRNSWVKNCVGIGLSSGFVEPLESTGIFFIQHGIEQLVHHFPSAELQPAAIRGYNRLVADCIDGVRDFLILHYRATDRADTAFWRATDDLALPDGFRDRFEHWRARLPHARTITPTFHGFEAYSYSVMLLGLNCAPAASLPVLDHLDPANALEAFRSLRRLTARLVRTLPGQREYLAHQRERARQPRAATGGG